MTAAAASQEETEAIAVVEDFLGALERLDIDRVLELSHPDITYQNVPFRPARGVAQFEGQLRKFERFATGFEARNHNIAANGSTVLTERTDVLEFGPAPVDLWVCGTFEIRDGKVFVWRDRFDFANFLAGTARGLAKGALSLVRSARS